MLCFCQIMKDIQFIVGFFLAVRWGGGCGGQKALRQTENPQTEENWLILGVSLYLLLCFLKKNLYHSVSFSQIILSE